MIVPPYGRLTAGLGGVGQRIIEDFEHFVRGGDVPEALAIGRVGGRVAPGHRCTAPVQLGHVIGGTRERRCRGR
jgi:hypothetical protein